MKNKVLSILLAIVLFLLAVNLPITVFAASYPSQTVVDLCNNAVGSSYANGYCLAFVKDMFKSAYGFSSSDCCAYKYGSSYIDSTGRNNIPLGASVFFGGSSKTCSTCKNKCGHIGIYVGDDCIVHAWSGKIVKYKIDRVVNAGYPYRGWGWHGNVVLTNTPISTNPDDYPMPTRDLVYKSSGTMTGNDVKWVQAVLCRLGYSVDIDGSYGPSTRDAIKQFQKDNGLTVDGSCGPATRSKLKECWEQKKSPYKLTIRYDTTSGSIKSEDYYIGSYDKVYKKASNEELHDVWVYNETKEYGLYNDTTFGLYKDGYSFAGWGTESNGGKVFDMDDTSLKPSDICPDVKNGDCSMTLFAQWKPNTLYVSYNVNGGELDSGKYGITSNNLISVIAENNEQLNSPWEYGATSEYGLYDFDTFGLYREGYLFAGWGTTPTGGRVFDMTDSTVTATDMNPDVKNGNCHVVLYAQWVKNNNKYSFTYNANGGVILKDNACTLTDGQVISNTNVKCVRKNYKLVGWTVKRNNDNQWRWTGHGWWSEKEGQEKGFTKAIYHDNESSTLGVAWYYPLLENCSYTFYAQWEYDANWVCSHSYTSKVTKTASCSETGIKTYTCVICGNTYTETIAKTSHTVVTDKAVAATCTTAGKTEGSHCSKCNAVIKAQTMVAALGHNWGSWSTTTAATCTKSGTQTRTCSRCKATETKTIIATGHNSVTDKAVAATCTAAGKTEGSHCSKCNAVIKAQTTVAALGHNWGSWSTTTAATCTKNGTQTRTCSRCKATETKIIAATGHRDGEWKVTTAPTYNSSGVKTLYCATCGAVIRTELIPALILNNSGVTGVDLGNSNVEINYHYGYQFDTSITVEGSIGYKVEYSSSNPKCVSVDENGNIYGNARGSAIITCTVTDVNGRVVKDTCTVNVKFTFGQWLLYIICFGWIWM